MTAAPQDTAVREYIVSFEGQDVPVHVRLDVLARRPMIDNFLPAVAKARELNSVFDAEAETRRITGFRKAGEPIRYKVEGEYTNGGTPPTLTDAVYAVDDECAEFQCKCAVAINEGCSFRNLVDLRKSMILIPVIHLEQEPYSKDDVTAALANFLSAYNAGENVATHIASLTHIAETCGHTIWKAGPSATVQTVIPSFGEPAYQRIIETPIRAIDFRLVLEPSSGLASVTNRKGEGTAPTDDSAAYAQVLTAAPRMVHAIRRALPWIEGTGIADSDPPEYLALRDALDRAIG
ncbi:hypothetical protein [Microvirga sp. VF16]|uniref:hypothetical protein n=1 Tax=Microvirga sp. VF16 TaxID=2807101 RepID=UPI00193E8DFB|nr:hypothetical protein [Microvirga sp. VF16]QRM34797.1 hypothetical protein JO965_41790 [Microvirga sp. VF16]